MAKQRLLFGDQSTADIKLQLIGTDGAEYEGNPLYLHFQVLKKSEFYETLLSERWCSEKPPIDIKITTTQSAQIYIKCFQVMYRSYAGKRFSVSNVDDALAILPVACEILFHQCLEECMRYLNAVPWSTVQEVKLRALVLSMEINISPDLAARLGMSSPHGGLQTLEKSLQKMLSSISGGSHANLSYIEVYIVAHFEANASFAETCRSALLKEFRANIERVKSDKYQNVLNACYALLWIIKMIQRLDEELIDTVVKMFCEDAEIPNAELRNAVINCCKNSSCQLFDLIAWFLTDLQNGRIVTSTSLRVSFLSKWVPIFFHLHIDHGHPYGYTPYGCTLEERLIQVIVTLPLAEQRRIYDIWRAVFTFKHRSVSDKIQRWVQNVDEAISNHQRFFS